MKDLLITKIDDGDIYDENQLKSRWYLSKINNGWQCFTW